MIIYVGRAQSIKRSRATPNQNIRQDEHREVANIARLYQALRVDIELLQKRNDRIARLQLHLRLSAHHLILCTAAKVREVRRIRSVHH